MPFNDLPGFDEADNQKENHPLPSQGISVPTESIDLKDVLTKDLTTSGSFDALGIKNTSFYKLLQALPIPAMLVNKSREIIFLNEACSRIDCDHEKLKGVDFANIFVGVDRQSIMVLIDEILRDRKPKIKEQELISNGINRWVRLYFRSIRLAKERAVLVLIEDLTLEKKQLLLLDKIVEAKKEWEQTFDTIQDIIAIVDATYNVVRLNKAAARKTGVNVREAVGQKCYKLLHGTDQPPSFCPYAKTLADGSEHSVEYFEKHLGGFYVESIFPNRGSNGLTSGCILVARDITESKRLEEELKRHATYDSLTNLLNRRTILSMLNSAIETARRYKIPLSLAICDVDYLKEINDEFGHQAGDRLLIEFSSVIKQELRKADLAGRYGGDEFLIILPHTDIRGAVDSMERIRNNFGAARLNFGARFEMGSCTIGIAEFDLRIPNAEALIHLADQALYKAKQAGRNRIAVSRLPAKPMADAVTIDDSS